ncbi:organic hydroperoxide resistance protein [Novosphingobium sp. 9]|uniref:organic hydroperoxide resistance protein n=1 Tax=Novosphingobium sp. 9 TaxID=2025349 RepID=UPI0021B68670|nr:organic hydroperoxide resistance protein [Novosphingobium sp. 9]
MISKILYETEATATGGRDGRARTTDGALNVWLDMPVELGGKGHGNNPEQLFAAGYAACFLSAMKAIAHAPHPAVPHDANVTARVAIGPREGGGFGLAIDLAISLPGIEADAGEALISAAHAVCPYSNAVRGNIDVTLELR